MTQAQHVLPILFIVGILALSTPATAQMHMDLIPHEAAWALDTVLVGSLSVSDRARVEPFSFCGKNRRLHLPGHERGQFFTLHLSSVCIRSRTDPL